MKWLKKFLGIGSHKASCLPSLKISEPNLSYEEYCELFEDELYIEFMESGAYYEFIEIEDWYEQKYDSYLTRQI